jgi:hypothetical protein
MGMFAVLLSPKRNRHWRMAVVWSSSSPKLTTMASMLGRVQLFKLVRSWQHGVLVRA